MDDLCMVGDEESRDENPYIRPRSLRELHPEEIRFYAKRFVWSSNRTGFYTRSGYKDGEGWYARKRQGQGWLPLYSDLVDDLIEKHLDFERFCRTCEDRSPLRPRIEETAFWFGTMSGDYTYYDCIDVDSHDRLGYYPVPTRFHEDHDPLGRILQWFTERDVPVMRVGLDYFKKLKLFHHHFPGRIWSFSSGSLGLNLYRMSPRAECPTKRYERVKEQLRTVRMDVLGGVKVEVFPEPPKTTGSKGHHQRRPCGMDMGVITDREIVTDPIEQIRLFMEPQTPSFEAVVEAIVARLVESYEKWLIHRDCSDAPKRELFDEQLAEIENVRAWMGEGCPELEEVLRHPSHQVLSLPSPILCGVRKEEENEGRLEILAGDQQDGSAGLVEVVDNAMFVTCDLRAINRSRQWVQFVMFLSEHGFPCEDSFFPVISTLTRWLYFYELYDVPTEGRVDRIKRLLRDFCLLKNNGFITRLNNGQEAEVLRNVDRLVDQTIGTVNGDGKATFMEMRHRRDRGGYREVYEIEGVLSNSLPSVSLPPSPILCEVLSEEEEDEEWAYVPDDSPLPDDLGRTIFEACERSRYRLMRINGEHPAVKAITRMINYLAASESHGRRASQMLLNLMGFPDNSKKREKLKKVLYDNDIIIKGDYRSKGASRKYVLTDRVVEMLAGELPVAVAS